MLLRSSRVQHFLQFLPTGETDWKDLPKTNLPGNTGSPTPIDLVKNYTNYYEFTFNKEDSTHLAQSLKIEPWSVEIIGEVEKPVTLNHLDEILSQQSLQEFVYRLRCVEGWSMVVPWVGFPLASLIEAGKTLVDRKICQIHLGAPT